MLIIKILCLLAVTMAAAQADGNNKSDSLLLTQNLSLDQAAKKIQKKINGRVLEAKTIQINGKQYYRFKVLTEKEGRIRYIKVDPSTGHSGERR